MRKFFLLVLSVGLLECSLGRRGHATDVPPLTVKLVSVQFDNDHPIFQDVLGQGKFSKPQYKVSTEGAVERVTSNPVCYTRGANLTLKATFQIANIPANRKLEIYAANIGGDFPGWNIPPVPVTAGTVTVELKPTRLIGTTPTPRMPRKVMKGAMNLRWAYNLSDKATPPNMVMGATVNDSSNKIYVTLTDPAPPKLFHTLLELSCHNDIKPNPEDTPTMGEDAVAMAAYKDKIVNATWDEFKGLNVMRSDSPVRLRYWSDEAMGAARVGDDAYAYVRTLLKRGEGQCGAWADFLRDCLLCHALQSDKIYLYAKYANAEPYYGDTRGLFFVKKWNLGLSDSAEEDFRTKAVFTYSMGVGQQTSDPTGLYAQGGYVPYYTKKQFVNHFIVRYHDPFFDNPAHGEKRFADRFYDPSYGTGPLFDAKSDDGKAAWEDASIAVFSKYFVLVDPAGKVTKRRLLKRNTLVL